jgi:hypothetical protein
MTAVQLGSNFVGAPAPYYIFFSVVEIATTAPIVWIAWSWRHAQDEASALQRELRGLGVAK